MRTSHIARCGLLALLLAGPGSLVYAQDGNGDSQGRAERLAAERDRKASDTAAPQRSLVERALYWYDNQYVLAKIQGGWNGFHAAGGGFPAGAGITFGAGFGRTNASASAPTLPNRVYLDTVAAYSTRGYARASAAFGLRRVGGLPVDVSVHGQSYDFPQEDFFGLGPSNRQENRTSYRQDGIDAGADVHWRPAKLIDLGGGVSFESPRIRSGTDPRFPSTEDLFDPAALPAFAEQPDFLRRAASLAVDWRDNPLHPHAGGRYAVEFSDFHDQDLDRYGFQRLGIDLQQYVPLPNRYRTLALRAAAEMTDPRAGQDVPFFYQPTLGGSQALRGFREFRYRDRNSLLLTAEYRWEASWLLDGALFVDAGKVAFDRSDLNLRDLNVSYGIGFRVHSNSAFVARLDLAYSREGFIPLLRFDHVF